MFLSSPKTLDGKFEQLQPSAVLFCLFVLFSCLVVLLMQIEAVCVDIPLSSHRYPFRKRSLGVA